MVNVSSKVFALAFLLVNITPAVMSQGDQFITGACASDAECASGCCGFNSGTCAGPVVAQERDGGCGFGDAQPNDDAAQALQGGQDPQAGAGTGGAGGAAAARAETQDTASNSTGNAARWLRRRVNNGTMAQ